MIAFRLLPRCSAACAAAILLLQAWSAGTAAAGEEAAVSSLEVNQIAGSAQWPPPLQRLVHHALDLTTRNLSYQFGSSDPDKGGMDCSGTIYEVLRTAGFKSVPRQSDQIYTWVKNAGLLTPVSGTPSLTDPVLARMRPGDLLFWTGTYDTGNRVVPVSHVMMYLGKTTAGKPVMFGASDGRPYEGERRNGVSVFDFRIPRAEGRARFVGYGPIPGLDVRTLAPVPPGGPAAGRKTGTPSTTGDSSAKKTSRSPAGGDSPSPSPERRSSSPPRSSPEARPEPGKSSPQKKTPPQKKSSGSRSISPKKSSTKSIGRPVPGKEKAPEKP